MTGNRRARFRQDDANRLVKAAVAAGVRSFRLDVMPDGTLSLVVGVEADKPGRVNSCDDMLNLSSRR